MAGRCSLAILFILAAAAPPVLAETYKWVDEKGVTNYSNKPPPGKVSKPQIVEERISVVAPDPSLGPAIATMRARTARQAQYDEADWQRRQRFMLAAQTDYSSAYCPYGADCGMGYGPPAYYPYSYSGSVFVAGTSRRFTPVFTHRSSFSSGRTGTMRSGRGSLR
jgi:hypothetical protein